MEAFFTSIKRRRSRYFNPTTLSDHCFESSLQSIIFLRCSILQQIPFELDAHIDSIQFSRHSHQQCRQDFFAAAYARVIGEFDHLQQCAIQRARDSWLSVLPLQSHHFDLSVQEFWDALALRYRKPLLNLPAFCDDCGSSFSVEHALDCRVGGLVGQCHNEVRDAVCDLATLVWSQVQKEPIVCEASHDDLYFGDT